MSPAAAAILEGMPDPRDPRRGEHDGMTFIGAGPALLACYPSGDAGMRNVAGAGVPQPGRGGRAGGAVGGAGGGGEGGGGGRGGGRRRGGPGGPGRGPGPAGELVTGGREPSPGAGLARVAGDALPTRYAGAMLAHAYFGRIGAEAILAAALPPALARPRYDDLGLLTATSMAFALGSSPSAVATHLIPAQAGILAGIGRLPDPR